MFVNTHAFLSPTRAQYFILYIALTTKVQIQTLGFGFEIGGLRPFGFWSQVCQFPGDIKKGILFLLIYSFRQLLYIYYGAILSPSKEMKEKSQ